MSSLFSGGVLDPRDPADRSALCSWLQLQAVLHLKPLLAVELLTRCSDPAAALRLSARAGVLDAAALRGSIETLRSRAVLAVPFTASAYPERLRTLPDAAPLLLVRGDPAVLRRRAVAIVGARAATAYGLEVARRLAGPLAAAGIVIISGLARGVDAAAHREALAAGGLTIAFQACGPDRTYPAGHRELADEVCASGAVVTEMPPGTPPRPAYFPLRNRLISGLAEIVIVVEARARSGSLVTARCALDQGRDVMAVPGPITAPTSEGPNRLVADGARPVLGPDDVFRELGIEPPAATAPAAERRREGSGERAILRSLAREPATKDVLARRLEMSPEVLALDLIELELAGRVGLDRDGRLRVLKGP